MRLQPAGNSQQFVVLSCLVCALIFFLHPPTYAQQTDKIARIGYLGAFTPSAGASLLEAFRQGLGELVMSRANIFIDYRWAEGKRDRLPAAAAELVNLRAEIIVT